MTITTLLDTKFDLFGLLEEQCDIVWPSFAFEGAYSSVQSVLAIALGTLPALAGAENIGFFLSWLRPLNNDAEQKPSGPKDADQKESEPASGGLPAAEDDVELGGAP